MTSRQQQSLLVPIESLLKQQVNHIGSSGCLGPVLRATAPRTVQGIAVRQDILTLIARSVQTAYVVSLQHDHGDQAEFPYTGVTTQACIPAAAAAAVMCAAYCMTSVSYSESL